MKHTPQTKRSAPTRSVLWSGAIRSSVTPKTATDPRMKRQRDCASVAATSAPVSAPAPKHEVTIPKVRGPAPSVSFASTGSRTLTLKEIDMTTIAISVNTSIFRSPRT